LIADLCAASSQVGFLPDFLARQSKLHSVAWQPDPSHYPRLGPLTGSRVKPFSCACKSSYLNGEKFLIKKMFVRIYEELIQVSTLELVEYD
jgi:hypothetical protein